MRIQVVTCNNTYYKGTYVNSYHEIHEITNLQSINDADHIISIVNDIVTNNILYKANNDVLDSVIISCNDSIILDKIIKYYEENPSLVNIMGAETAMGM